MKRIKTELRKWDDTLSSDKMPNDATKLSYWVTQNVPLDDSLKLHLLSINSAEQRLRCALNIICKVQPTSHQLVLCIIELFRINLKQYSVCVTVL